MAIKTKTIQLQDESEETLYLYAECRPYEGTVMSIRALGEDDRDGEITGYSGASNETRLLEIDDSIPDCDTDELQLDAVNNGTEEEPDWSFSVSLDTVARQAKYEEKLRDERDQLLKECDWMTGRHRDQVENSETPSLSEVEFGELLAYRKLLRDWPSEESDLYNRTAPTKPHWM